MIKSLNYRPVNLLGYSIILYPLSMSCNYEYELLEKIKFNSMFIGITHNIRVDLMTKLYTDFHFMF